MRLMDYLSSRQVLVVIRIYREANINLRDFR